VLVVFGTRPEAIKMAPLVLGLRARPRDFEVIVCVTGQHRQMLDQVLEIFNITPDIDLDLMKPNQEMADVTASILIKISEVLKDTKPDLVLVHGDTTTTLATSLGCFYQGIRVGHVEAGLRTGNLHSPFPEEFNRQVVSLIADLHFAPTETCRLNLLNEGVDPEEIFVTGNTVIDALFWTLSKIKDDSTLREAVIEDLDKKLQFKWQSERFVLVTGHRRENFGEGFQEICLALSDLSEKYPKLQFIYPVHLNPNVHEPVFRILGKHKNIALIAPLDYLSFSMLLRNCLFVLTDSGGIQEEAPSLGKPVLLMRTTTERPEGVLAGTTELVGANREQIVRSASLLIEDEEVFQRMANSVNPYGSGNSVESILRRIQ
jgi:UDP-N-acetylglucosamine 2-epimerase (non-hydrolysing)